MTSTFTLYDATIPTFVKGLKAFQHILTKAEEFAEEKGLEANSIFPEARLIDDQLPFTFQVQNATRTVLVNLGRLTGVEPTPFENKEKTIQELHKRIRDTLDLLAAVDASQVNSRGEKLVDL
jgi:uncharacterized protein